MSTELFQFFIQCKTRRFGREFKKNAAVLAEIDGMKVNPIHHRRDIVTEIDQMLPPLKLFGIALDPKSNVMHRSDGDASRLAVRQANEIENTSGDGIVRRSEPITIPRLFHQSITEVVCQQAGSRFVAIQGRGHAMKTVESVFCRHRTFRPRFNWQDRAGSDQFQHQPIWIGQSNHVFTKSRKFFGGDMLLLETFQPITSRVRRNHKRRRFNLAGAATPATRPWPWKKRHDRSRRPPVVAEIEMIRSGIVEVDCAFDETQSKESDVEIKVSLRIARNRGDMVKPANFLVHR